MENPMTHKEIKELFSSTRPAAFQMFLADTAELRKKRKYKELRKAIYTFVLKCFEMNVHWVNIVGFTDSLYMLEKYYDMPKTLKHKAKLGPRLFRKIFDLPFGFSVYLDYKEDFNEWYYKVGEKKLRLWVGKDTGTGVVEKFTLKKY